MKLLLLSPSHARGGAEEYLLTIGIAARHRGWSVDAACPLTSQTESLREDFAQIGAHYHRASIAEDPSLKMPGWRGHLVRMGETTRILLAVRPDVVHLTLPWMTFSLASILACALLHIPTVVVFQLAPFNVSLPVRQQRLYAWARSRRQHWVAVSESNRGVLATVFHVPREHIRRIYNGARLPEPADRQQRRTLHRTAVLKELGLVDPTLLILTVGRLNAQKGYDDLIPAIPYVLQEFPQARFVWVGDGEDRSVLQDRLRSYGISNSVLMLGYRRDVSRLLSAADLFVFPSHFEGLPFALVEAVAHGTPVVAADASSIPEVISNGVHGVLFRSADSCSLLEALQYALRNPKRIQELAQHAMAQTATFDEERTVRETLDLLDAAGRKPRA